MNSKNKGNIGEAKVIADLIERGFDIAQPFGDNLPFDLIVIDDKIKLSKVQVKYSSLDKRGTFCLRTERITSNTSGNYTYRYEEEQVDVYAIFCPDTDTVYYVSANFIHSSGKIKTYFRTAQSKNNQQKNLNLAENFKEFPINSDPEGATR